jgi:hypothetical protein
MLKKTDLIFRLMALAQIYNVSWFCTVGKKHSCLWQLEKFQQYVNDMLCRQFRVADAVSSLPAVKTEM